MPKVIEEKKTRVELRLSPDTAELLRVASFIQRRPVSAIMDELVREKYAEQYSLPALLPSAS